MGEKKWKVRAEIVGDFVINETFDNEFEARVYEAKLIYEGIWDSIDVWEI